MKHIRCHGPISLKKGVLFSINEDLLVLGLVGETSSSRPEIFNASLGSIVLGGIPFCSFSISSAKVKAVKEGSLLTTGRSTLEFLNLKSKTVTQSALKYKLTLRPFAFGSWRSFHVAFPLRCCRRSWGRSKWHQSYSLCQKRVRDRKSNKADLLKEVVIEK